MPSIKSYFIKINKRKLTDPFNRILSFVITYHPAVKNLTQKMLERWSLMKIQPLLRACDDIIQKSKFLTDTQVEPNFTAIKGVKKGSKKKRTNTRNLKVRQASCIKVRRCCRETLTNCYLICMNSKGNPREEQAIRPLNAMLKSLSLWMSCSPVVLEMVF